MKIALITDTHWGIRNDHQALIENNKRFLDNTFFPYLQQHKIDTIIHLGDLVDKRKQINFNTAQRLRTDFIDKVVYNDYRFYWILGNHDVYFRESLAVNAADELYRQYSITEHGFKYFSRPEEIEFDGLPILFLPWICDENREVCYEAIKETNAQILFGHLELAGFEMFKGVLSHHGESADLFKKFDLVCSGHYHQKSSHDNIHYLGAHGEFTWADYNCERGFHIFDTTTRSLSFVANPYCMFRKVFYDDSTEDYKATDFSQLTDRFVKIIVTNRTNQYAYDWFLGKVDEASPIEYIVVQDHLNLDLVADSDIVNESKDTLTIMREYAQVANGQVNAAKLDNLFVDLYQQAQSLE